VSVPRLFVPSPAIQDERVELPAGEGHHAMRVLRLRDGDSVRIFDGTGREWAGTLVAAPVPAVAALREVVAVAEPAVRLTLALGVLKGDQMDTAVRDATMLGVAAIQPMVTDHVTVPPRAWQSGAAIERWRRVAIASAKQCGRAVVPEIAPIRAFADIVAAPADASRAAFMCVEPAVNAQAFEVGVAAAKAPPAAVIHVGPEGGWSETEIARAREAAVVLISLGPRTLRAEAVPAVALAALWTTWGW
jgi:16S rRNA (uracil1498-N3)-methyltransferase